MQQYPSSINPLPSVHSQNLPQHSNQLSAQYPFPNKVTSNPVVHNSSTKYQPTGQHMLNPINASSNLVSAEEVHRIWGPFRPLPLLLSDSILGFGWQEKYLALRQVFGDALEKQQGDTTTVEPRLTYDEFEHIMRQYPCLGKAYFRSLFSFLDCQRKGSIEETDFISGMLASAPDAPSIISKECPRLQLTLTDNNNNNISSVALGATTTERDTGISPITLIRLQMIFLYFDADGDGILNLCELTHLITRLLIVLASDKRAGRETAINHSSIQVPLGPSFWKIVQPFSCPADTGFKGETGRAVPRNTPAPMFFSSPVTRDDTKDLEFSAFLAPAKKTLGDLFNTGIKKIFGAKERHEDKGCRQKKSGQKQLSKNSDRKLPSEGVSRPVTAYEEVIERSSHRPPRSVEQHQSKKNEGLLSRSKQESYRIDSHNIKKNGVDLGNSDKLWNYGAFGFMASSPPYLGSTSSSVTLHNKHVKHETNPEHETRKTKIAPQERNESFGISLEKSNTILTTASSIGSSLAFEVASSIANSGLTQGIGTLLNSVSSGTNIFGRTCTGETSDSGRFLCGNEENERSNEFVVDDRPSHRRDDSRLQSSRIDQQESSLPPSPRNRGIEYEMHCNLYGCYSGMDEINHENGIPLQQTRQFSTVINHTASPAIVHRSGRSGSIHQQNIEPYYYHQMYHNIETSPQYRPRFVSHTTSLHQSIGTSRHGRISRSTIPPMKRSSSIDLKCPSLGTSRTQRDNLSARRPLSQSSTLSPLVNLGGPPTTNPSLSWDSHNIPTTGRKVPFYSYSGSSAVQSIGAASPSRETALMTSVKNSQNSLENEEFIHRPTSHQIRSTHPPIPIPVTGRLRSDHHPPSRYSVDITNSKSFHRNHQRLMNEFDHQVAMQTTTTSTSIAPSISRCDTIEHEPLMMPNSDSMKGPVDRKVSPSSRPLSQIPPDMLDYWRRLFSEDIARELIQTYDLFGDRRGLCFAEFIHAIRNNDIPGTELLLRTREDFVSVVKAKQNELLEVVKRSASANNEEIETDRTTKHSNDNMMKSMFEDYQKEESKEEKNIIEREIGDATQQMVDSATLTSTLPITSRQATEEILNDKSIEKSETYNNSNSKILHLDLADEASRPIIDLLSASPMANSLKNVALRSPLLLSPTLFDSVVKDDSIRDQSEEKQRRNENLMNGKESREFLDLDRKGSDDLDFEGSREKNDGAVAPFNLSFSPDTQTDLPQTKWRFVQPPFLQFEPKSIEKRDDAVNGNFNAKKETNIVSPAADDLFDRICTRIHHQPSNSKLLTLENSNSLTQQDLYSYLSTTTTSEPLIHHKQLMSTEPSQQQLSQQESVPMVTCQPYNTVNIRKQSSSPSSESLVASLGRQLIKVLGIGDKPRQLGEALKHHEVPAMVKEGNRTREEAHDDEELYDSFGLSNAEKQDDADGCMIENSSLQITTPRMEYRLKSSSGLTDEQNKELNKQSYDKTTITSRKGSKSTAERRGKSTPPLLRETSGGDDLSWKTVALLQTLAETHERHLSLARRTVAMINRIKSAGWIGPTLNGAITQSSLSLDATCQLADQFIIRYHDSIGKTDVSMSPFEDRILPLRCLWNLCEAVVDLLRYEPVWIKLRIGEMVGRQGPVYVISSPMEKLHKSDCEKGIQGNKGYQTPGYSVHGLLEHFMVGKEENGSTNENKAHQTPTVILLGSTEDFFVANAFGLEEECCSRYGESNGREILRRIFDVFEFLPLCASIEFPKIIPTLSGTTTKSVQKMLLLTGDVPTSTAMFKQASSGSVATTSVTVATTPKNPISSLILSFVNCSENANSQPKLTPISATQDNDYFNDSIQTPIPQDHQDHIKHGSTALLSVTPDNKSKSSIFCSCASRNQETDYATARQLPGSRRESRIDELLISRRGGGSLDPLLEDFPSQYSTKDQSVIEHKNLDVKEELSSDNNYFEIVWGKHDMYIFNQKIRDELIDFENVGKRVENWPSLETPRKKRSVLSDSSFFGEDYLNSSRFSSLQRYRLLMEIDYEFLARPVMFSEVNGERLISFESRMDLRRADTSGLNGHVLCIHDSNIQMLKDNEHKDQCYQFNSAINSGSTFRVTPTGDDGTPPSTSISLGGGCKSQLSPAHNDSSEIYRSGSVPHRTHSSFRNALKYLIPSSGLSKTRSNSSITSCVGSNIFRLRSLKSGSQ